MIFDTHISLSFFSHRYLPSERKRVKEGQPSQMPMMDMSTRRMHKLLVQYTHD